VAVSQLAYVGIGVAISAAGARGERRCLRA
jgi:hypothetical protein